MTIMKKISYQRLFFVIGALSVISTAYLCLEYNYSQDLIQYGLSSSLYDDAGTASLPNPIIQVLIDSILALFRL